MVNTIHKTVDTAALERFVDWVREMKRRDMEERYPNLEAPEFEIRPGRVNAKIVETQPGQPGGSVFCFVDMATGKIMKAASWNAPDPKRYERGNVNNPEGWSSWVTPYGPKYLK